MDTVPRHYIPGVCNIGAPEIRLRKAWGWAMLLVTVAVFAVFFVIDVSRWWRLVVFPAAFGAAYGLIQGYAGFCATYGILGVFNLGPDAGRTETVRDRLARKRDRRRALRMVLTSIAVAAVVTLTLLAVPT